MEEEPARKKRRTNVKCDECRLRKVKCLPVDRQWDAERQQKCDACKKAGKDCGPNVRFDKPNDSDGDRHTRKAIHQMVADYPTPPRPLANIVSAQPREEARVHPNPLLRYSTPPLRHLRDLRVDSGIADVSNVGDLQSSTTTDLKRYLRANLSRLRCLLSLCRYLHERRKAVTKLQPRVRFLLYEDVSKAMDLVIHEVDSIFLETASRICQSAIDLDEAERELALRRLEDILHEFQSPRAYYTTDRSATADPVSRRIAPFRARTLQGLIALYEKRGEAAECLEFRERLVRAAPSFTNSHATVLAEAKNLVSLSEESSEIFRELDLPSTLVGNLCFDAGVYPPLHAALMSRRSAVAFQLVDGSYAHYGETDLLQRHALHLAAEVSNESLLETIMHDVPELLKVPDIYGMTPLCVAAYVGNLSFFDKILSYCEARDLETTDSEHRDVLCIACDADRLAIVEMLLAKGADPNRRDPDNRQFSALHAAAAAGSKEIVLLLLERGAYATLRSQGLFASHLATKNRHDEVARILLEAEDKEFEAMGRVKQNLTSLSTPLEIENPLRPTSFTLRRGSESDLNSRDLRSSVPTEFATNGSSISSIAYTNGAAAAHGVTKEKATALLDAYLKQEHPRAGNIFGFSPGSPSESVRSPAARKAHEVRGRGRESWGL